MALKKIGIGVIGCGAISDTYLPNIYERFSLIRIVGVADLIPEKAALAAERYDSKVMTNEEIYNCPEIAVVVNLTNVWSHYEVTKAALTHGKHVYSEKMMAENFGRAKELYDLAAEKGLRLAMAPDTCLGGAYQTIRKLVDDGFIGKPFAVNAMLVRSYLQTEPEMQKYNVFFPGGTIPYDMGGYYLQAMQTVFGAIRRVSGFCTYLPKTFSNPANPKYKEPFTVDAPESPNFIQGAFEFECGMLGSLMISDYGVMEYPAPGLYIFGTEGTLLCPDPNEFGGKIRYMRRGMGDYVELPIIHGYNGEEQIGWTKGEIPPEVKNWASSRRGVGVADLCWAIANGRPQRLSNEMGLHTIEVIHGIIEGAESGKYYEMTTHPKRMMPLRAGFIGSDAEAVFDDVFDEDFDAEPKWDR